LLKAIKTLGNPLQPVQIQPYTRRLFRVEATVVIDPRYSPDKVKPAVVTALHDAFNFTSREFGQGVTASEVITVIQSVPGIVALDLNEFHFKDRPPTREPVLEANTSYVAWDAGKPVIHAAELLLIDAEGGIHITEMSA
jgi:hypothetical protein